MLAVTQAAAVLIQRLVEGFPEGAGLRVAVEKPGNGTEPEFSLHVAARPLEGDAVVEHAGATVFLDPAAAGYFEDKVLDADGEDTFTFAPG